MPTRLILIRHGQTRWNLEKKYLSFTDIGLNLQGIKQAGKLKRRLNNEKISRVYSSDSKRAMQTAKIIFNELAIQKMPDLREMHFGCFEGSTYQELMKKYPKIYKKWLADPFGAAIPKGEDLGDFKKRVVKAFKKIISANPNKTVAVVCHGGVIAIFLTHILKTNDFWKLIPACASMIILDNKQGRLSIQSGDVSGINRKGVPLGTLLTVIENRP